jgi:hypothetical protein
MKKIILTLIAIIVCCSNFGQNRVELNNVEKIAKEVYKRKNNVGDVKIAKPIPIVSNSVKDTLLYIVPYEKDGFAIVSGIFEVSPILGFCDSGIYNPDIMPPGLLYLIDKYKSEIEKIKTIGVGPTKQVEQQWEEYLSENQLKSFTVGNELIKTTWSQQNSFNQFCPAGCPAGCTAVAMAQILRYWACRIAPTGTAGTVNIGATSYNWNGMSNTVANSENSKLIWHAGLSCDTYYGTSGSTSTPGKARDGFVINWGISSNADVRWRSMHLNTWSDDLKGELDLNRPILYSGAALVGNGHSWVLDAYYSNGNFHCNWGWYNGQYNGEYSLGGFDPPGDLGPYNQYESAIFNVYPVQTTGVATPTLSNQSFTYNATGYTLTVPPAFGATSYQWITNKGTITGSGTNAILVANSTATVQVMAYNSRCDIYSPYQSATITINYGPISAPDIICYGGSTVSIINVPNTTITWSGTNVSFPNGNTGTSVTVRATSSSTSGNGTITASFTVDGVSKTVSKTVWVGPPSISYISGPNYTPNNQWATFTAQPVSTLSAPTDYNWVLNPLNSNVVYDYGATADVAFYSLGTYQLVVQAQNTCPGYGPYAVLNSIEVYDSYGLLISPNPTSGETTLTVESASEEKTVDETVSWELDVYDNAQNLKLNNPKVKGKEYKFNTSGWKEGVYIVRVKYKDEILTGKLVVKQ